MNPSEKLSFVNDLLDEPTLLPGRWPRAAAWTMRLALEQALQDYLRTRYNGLADSKTGTQLHALGRLTDRQLGRTVSELWHQLSRVSHHHDYDLAPTVGELRRWLTSAQQCVIALRRPDGGAGDRPTPP